MGNAGTNTMSVSILGLKGNPALERAELKSVEPH